MAKKINLNRINIELDNISQDMAELTRIGVSKIANDTLAAFIEDTPRDKGHLEAEWDILDQSGGSGGLLVKKVIFNRLPYMEPVELGSPKGQLPWKVAGPRTREKDGRIYSSQAVGGVIQPIIDSGYFDDAADELSNFISKGL